MLGDDFKEGQGDNLRRGRPLYTISERAVTLSVQFSHSVVSDSL